MCWTKRGLSISIDSFRRSISGCVRCQTGLGQQSLHFPLRALYVWGAYLPFSCSMHCILYVNILKISLYGGGWVSLGCSPFIPCVSFFEITEEGYFCVLSIHQVTCGCQIWIMYVRESHRCILYPCSSSLLERSLALFIQRYVPFSFLSGLVYYPETGSYGFW